MEKIPHGGGDWKVSLAWLAPYVDKLASDERVDFYTVSKLLGHCGTVTEGYAHVASAQLQVAPFLAHKRRQDSHQPRKHLPSHCGPVAQKDRAAVS
jgi:hypothetical protein